MEASSTRPAFAIIGPGRVGRALGRRLVVAGYPLAGVIARDEAQAAAAAVEMLQLPAGTAQPVADAEKTAVLQQAQLLFVATPDRAIRAVATELAELMAQLPSARRHRGERAAFHLSGALPAEELEPLRTVGFAVASLHPNQSFAAAAAVDSLRGIAWGLEGDPAAVAWGRRVVADLEGIVLEIEPSRKALYHAAACVASNYLAVLLHMATRLYEAAGIPAAKAFEALVPLMRGSLDNAVQMGLPDALTGPIERGDAATVQRHLEAMRAARVDPQVEAMYRILGGAAVELASAKGSIAAETALALRELLDGPTGIRTGADGAQRG